MCLLSSRHPWCLPLVTEDPSCPQTFLPAALTLERSVDHGRSWRVCRYFAHNCSGLFPGVARAPGHSASNLVCDQRYSDIEPSTEGKVRPRGGGRVVVKPEAQACFFLRSFSKFWTQAS